MHTSLYIINTKGHRSHITVHEHPVCVMYRVGYMISDFKYCNCEKMKCNHVFEISEVMKKAARISSSAGLFMNLNISNAVMLSVAFPSLIKPAHGVIAQGVMCSAR